MANLVQGIGTARGEVKGLGRRIAVGSLSKGASEGALKGTLKSALKGALQRAAK
jgi:hypothetical protein